MERSHQYEPPPVDGTETRHPQESTPISPWTIDESEALYNIHGWGDPYFSINAAGHITVSPKGDRGGSLDLVDIVESLKQRQLELPLLLQFPDILEDRMERLHRCFAQAIARYAYPGRYQGVFPIKCNQHRHFLEALVQGGHPHQFGLEAGSKPELMIALASLNTPGALLICNGYKDREYVETALLAQRLGHHAIVVLEQPSELDMVLALSRQLNVTPRLGVRAKLSIKGSGRWAGTTGDRAKFGLTIPEIITVVDTLRTTGHLHCLQLLHFHIGSQISSISIIKDALREASHIYVELVRLGARMGYLDVGGGLGVDYNGAKTNGPASKNYNMQNYANDVVAAVKESCEAASVPVPILVSESGRAIASHQSVLIFDIVGASGVMEGECSADSHTPLAVESFALLPFVVKPTDPLVLRNLWDTYHSLSHHNYQEVYHDAIQFKEEALSLFGFGYLTIADRARVEELYWACCHRVLHIARQDTTDVPADILDLELTMASIYYANLSVFRSIPDAWAINQLFPIVPIHRLTEAPTRRAIVADLTCDSDGKISQFIHRHQPQSLLDVHPLNQQPYYLGVFLSGAYQDSMGNLHNLFGQTHRAHIRITANGYTVDPVVRGDTIAAVLQAVHYNGSDLLESLRHRTEAALRDRRMTLQEAQQLLQHYERSLQGYTYLTSTPAAPADQPSAAPLQSPAVPLDPTAV